MLPASFFILLSEKSFLARALTDIATTVHFNCRKKVSFGPVGFWSLLPYQSGLCKHAARL
jgi:hypothetical protein